MSTLDRGEPLQNQQTTQNDGADPKQGEDTPHDGPDDTRRVPPASVTPIAFSDHSSFSTANATAQQVNDTTQALDEIKYGENTFKVGDVVLCGEKVCLLMLIEVSRRQQVTRSQADDRRRRQAARRDGQ